MSFLLVLNKNAKSTSVAALSVALSFSLLLAASLSWRGHADTHSDEQLSASDFLILVDGAESAEELALLNRLDRTWSHKMLPMVIETMSYTRSNLIGYRLRELLIEHTKYQHAEDTNDWYHWLWNQPESVAKDYAEFKAGLYRQIDPKFEPYFNERQATARIRLDEIRWGGVGQDGIPPLRDPEMIGAKQQQYLEDDNIVFGVKINGEARAYPKRILAWHEMFTDTFGEEAIAGVYCALCGTVIIYKTQHDGIAHRLGTSGFLYRSNKLMYDKDTNSLWNTVRGEPVVGPLVDKGIQLEHLSVVTTTWGEWKRRHPETQVLSLNTGHQRDYGEGVAYQDYFSTDRLMFNTPFNDQRLKNKREVLALRFQGAPKLQLAIDTEFLNNNRIFYERVGQQQFVVLTDDSGANRVYTPNGIKFERYDGKDTVLDSKGHRWLVTEEALVNDNGDSLPRLPYHRAFWFGWHAAYPETRLIK